MALVEMGRDEYGRPTSPLREEFEGQRDGWGSGEVRRHKARFKTSPFGYTSPYTTLAWQAFQQAVELMATAAFKSPETQVLKWALLGDEVAMKAMRDILEEKGVTVRPRPGFNELFAAVRGKGTAQ